MTRRGVIGIILAGVGGLAVSACGQMFPTTYRFKMTVEVETPQGLRTGSSVYEVKAVGTTNLITNESGSKLEFRGEAVAVEIGAGKTLFALIRTVNPARDNVAEVATVALDPAYDYDRRASAGRIAKRQGIRSPAQVTQGDWPLLVTFTDIRDPKSVVRVDPAVAAATLGPGVRVKRITLAVTDEAVTIGIEKRLGWLSGYRNMTFAGNRYAVDSSLPDSLGAGAFTTENLK